MGNAAANDTVEHQPQVLNLIRQAAHELGLDVRILDPEYGHLFALTDGRRSIALLGGRSPLNDSVAARICEDKYYTGLLLEQAGLRVPASARCLKPGHFQPDIYQDKVGQQPGVAFARRHGFPVIVKPNRMSHGREICVVNSSVELSHAIDRVWRVDYIALVQEPIPGVDVRLDYLNGTYLAGYVRTTGTNGGDRSAATGEPERIEILNLARGAQATVLDSPPEAWHTYCIHIGRLLNLRHFGVDLRTTSLDADPTAATVIEVNASPLLLQLHKLGFTEQALRGQVEVLRAIWATPGNQGGTNS
jgi:glutathione synthase/RimK-type ligase-like ATP-grasp enzyme